LTSTARGCGFCAPKGARGRISHACCWASKSSDPTEVHPSSNGSEFDLVSVARTDNPAGPSSWGGENRCSRGYLKDLSARWTARKAIPCCVRGIPRQDNFARSCLPRSRRRPDETPPGAAGLPRPGMGEYFVEVSSPAVQSSGPGTEGNRQAPPRSGVGGDRLQLAASGSIVQASDGTDPSATWERGFLAVMASSP